MRAVFLGRWDCRAERRRNEGGCFRSGNSGLAAAEEVVGFEEEGSQAARAEFAAAEGGGALGKCDTILLLEKTCNIQ